MTAVAPAIGRAGARLAPFHPSHAPIIARWARSDDELFWLAPATPPPLTAARVLAWGREGQRFTWWDAARRRPIGYSELDFLSAERTGMWIGHFVIDPEQRGRGLGGAFLEALLQRAFDGFRATEVVLLAFSGNEPALACYRRAGFVFDCPENRYFAHTRRTHELLRFRITAAAFRGSRTLPAR